MSWKFTFINPGIYWNFISLLLYEPCLRPAFTWGRCITINASMLLDTRLTRRQSIISDSIPHAVQPSSLRPPSLLLLPCTSISSPSFPRSAPTFASQAHTTSFSLKFHMYRIMSSSVLSHVFCLAPSIVSFVIGVVSPE